MLDFIYNTPTKVYFGKDKEKEVGKNISEFGVKKVMLHYGKESIKKSGLYDTVVNSLKNSGIEYVDFGGVEPNPKVDLVRKGIELARQTGAQMILAVGGGSVIDSSKAIALGSKNDCDIWDVFMGQVKPKDALPVGCILTISAAGSEMSSSMVLTDLESNSKKGFSSELIRCKFAIMNPELTFSVSPYQTACGIVDMMSHTMERYFTALPDTFLTDRIAESILKSIIYAGEKVIKNPKDYEARATLMWASSLSHNGLTGCGRENYLAVHQLEHALSGVYDEVSHGAGLAVLYPAWARYVLKGNEARFSTFARNVFDVKEDDDLKAAEKGIEKMQEFFVSLGLPKNLSEFGVQKERLEELVLKTTFNNTRTIKSYKPLGFKEIKEIFISCY